MAKKSDLDSWVRRALYQKGGRGTVVAVAEQISGTHEAELRESGDLFYTWQYDMRWAANRLRRRGIMKSVTQSRSGIWELARSSRTL